MKALLAAIALFALVGCGGGGGGQSSASIVGTWTLDSMSTGNQEVGCPGEITVQNTMVSCVRDQLEFKSDFSVIRHPSDGSDDIDGVWTMHGTILTIQMGDTTEEVEVAFSPSGDSFSAFNTVDGQNLTYEWTRG